MHKQGRLVALIFLLIAIGISGCVGTLWTGANLVYVRHGVYKKLNDYRLYVDVTNALFFDKKLKGEGKSLDIAVINGDILIVGHLPTHELLIEERQRLDKVKKYRRLFNQISISDSPANNVEDGWITTKIRSGIFADDSIDPNAFKVVTSDRIVYLMGDVKKDEADKVIAIARKTDGVLRVVTLMKYFTYQSK